MTLSLFLLVILRMDFPGMSQGYFAAAFLCVWVALAFLGASNSSTVLFCKDSALVQLAHTLTEFRSSLRSSSGNAEPFLHLFRVRNALSKLVTLTLFAEKFSCFFTCSPADSAGSTSSEVAKDACSTCYTAVEVYQEHLNLEGVYLTQAIVENLNKSLILWRRDCSAGSVSERSVTFSFSDVVGCINFAISGVLFSKEPVNIEASSVLHA